jgi:hypothetical protein
MFPKAKRTDHSNKSYKYAEGGAVRKPFYERGESTESAGEYDKTPFDPEIGVKSGASAGPLKKLFDYVPSTAGAAIAGNMFASNREIDDAKRALVRSERKRQQTDKASGE